MICPHCGHDNLPGSEECSRCLQDLTQLDLPAPHNRIERSLMEDPVSVLAPGRPITLPQTATVRQAMDTMLAHDIGAILVLDGQGKLAGIFSERDLLLKVSGIHDDFEHLAVAQFMTVHPETVVLTDSLAFALHKMDIGGYRHLPVIEHGVPLGVISVRNMLRHITRLCNERA
jgi:CBS domain-containing protein